MMFKRLLSWCALALFLVACGGSEDPPSEASATIGAAGGTLEGPDGVQVVVPPGALTQDTTLRIARVNTGAPPLPEGYRASTAMYEFTPHGLRFEKPVLLRMPYAAPAGAGDADVLMASPGEEWMGMRPSIRGGVAEWYRQTLSWGTGVDCAVQGTTSNPTPCANTRPNVNVQMAAAPLQALVAVPYGTGPISSAWTVAHPADLRFTLGFSAPPDCGDTRVRVRRFNGSAAGNLLLDTAVTLQPPANGSQRARGSATFDHAMTDEFKGFVTLAFWFTCQRPGRTSREADGYHFFFDTRSIAPLPPVAPSIVIAPFDRSVTEPASATFASTASGQPVPAVQWQRSNDGGATWFDIAGASDAIYNTPATSLADNGARFRAVWTNAAGQVPSAAATLTVLPAPAQPAFTTQPANQRVTSGASATFTAAVTGNPAPTLQWQVSTDGGVTWSDIAGANGLTYTTSPTQPSDDGKRYRVVASNANGGATSDTAVLTVDIAETVVFAWSFDTDMGDTAPFVGAEPELRDVQSGALLDDQFLARSRVDGQGFNTLSGGSTRFSGNLARLPTGSRFTLALSGLPAHSALSLRFLLAAIDSLDGTGSFPSGDYLRIEIDGVTVFRESFENSGAGPQSYAPAPGVELARKVDLGFGGPGGFYTDSAYDMALEPRLQRIPHSRSSATIVFTFEGAGVQPLEDESWGIDNLRVVLH